MGSFLAGCDRGLEAAMNRRVRMGRSEMSSNASEVALRLGNRQSDCRQAPLSSKNITNLRRNTDKEDS